MSRTDEAFYAYIDRLNARPKKVIIEAGELDHLPLEEQIRITAQRMRVHFGHKLDPGT